MNPRDCDIIRRLATQVAEIAALPAQAETIRLWKALNRLAPERPMVAIDQIPWHEMDVDGELKNEVEDEFLRRIETGLRRTIYRWRHMRADMVVEPIVTLGKAIRGADFGIRTLEKTASTDPLSSVRGHSYIDQLETEADVAKIRDPEVWHDAATSARAEEKARAALDGILDVRMQGLAPMFRVWDLIVHWHGAGNVLMDLAARPELLHAIMARTTEASLSLLDQLESQGLLGQERGLVHCSGAWTDELPAPGYDPARPRACDLWTSGMAQIFTAVSPAMRQEFELDYANRWFARFGLVYYGCCEPLDRQIGVIRGIPHVRKISMSPWVDQERGAAEIGGDFVFSRKPSPACFARDSWSPGAPEQDLRETLGACRRHGCPLEFILKDISTVRYEPRRLWEWAEMSRRVVGA